MRLQTRIVALAAVWMLTASSWGVEQVLMSRGRAPDSTAKILSEIRESERRKIPIEVALKVRAGYKASDPITVTVTVTNLFEPPLLLNGRLLVNHRLLPGELSFLVMGPDGQRCEFQRLVSPMELRDEDFVLLARGMSIQRSVDLADFYSIHKRGRYKIQVFYRNDVDEIVNGSKAWMGIASSDVNEIEIQ